MLGSTMAPSSHISSAVMLSAADADVADTDWKAATIISTRRCCCPPETLTVDLRERRRSRGKGEAAGGYGGGDSCEKVRDLLNAFAGPVEQLAPSGRLPIQDLILMQAFNQVAAPEEVKALAVLCSRIWALEQAHPHEGCVYSSDVIF